MARSPDRTRKAKGRSRTILAKTKGMRKKRGGGGGLVNPHAPLSGCREKRRGNQTIGGVKGRTSDPPKKTQKEKDSYRCRPPGKAEDHSECRASDCFVGSLSTNEEKHKKSKSVRMEKGHQA